jgi:hypothetical protein
MPDGMLQHVCSLLLASMRLVDCRRAAHFAHFNAEDEEDTNDGDNVHVGGEEVRSTDVHSIAYGSENVVL